MPTLHNALAIINLQEDHIDIGKNKILWRTDLKLNIASLHYHHNSEFQ